MLTAALFKMPPKLKQLKCLSNDKCMNTTGYVQPQEGTCCQSQHERTLKTRTENSQSHTANSIWPHFYELSRQTNPQRQKAHSIGYTGWEKESGKWSLMGREFLLGEDKNILKLDSGSDSIETHFRQVCKLYINTVV
jgi:hypothetical protein